jgi:hypothetical protein
MRSRICLLVLLLVILPVIASAADGEATVVGTVTDATSPVFSLRVDRVETEGAPRPGQVLPVEPTRELHFRVRVGEQLRLVMTPTLGSHHAAWRVETAPERLGRGELVDPGQGASFDSGAPDAHVLVKFFAPLHADCHQETVKALKELAAQERSRVRVQIFDLTQAPSRAEAEREGLTCASVLVNNRVAFTLGDRPVALHHRPNQPGSSYRSEDVRAVVAQELQRLYPPPAS